jgi:hypothetical protein
MSTGTKNSMASMYVATVTAAGAAVIALSVRNLLAADYGRTLYAWAAITLLTAFVGELSLKLPVRGCRLSFSDALIFLAFLVFGVDLATITAAVDGYTASSRRKGAWHKRLFNTTAMAIAINVAARLFHWLLPAQAMAAGARLRVIDLVAPLLLIAGAQYAVNTALVSVAVVLEKGASLLDIWRRTFSWNGLALISGAAAAGIVFLVMRTVGIGSFVTILPVPIVLYHSYRIWKHRTIERKALVHRG